MRNNENIISLWDDEFPSLDLNDERKHEQLRVFQEKYSQFDPYYVRAWVVMKNREEFDTQWNKYKILNLADSNFLTEIRTHFHQRTWEMWMWIYLKSHPFSVTSKNEWPDCILNDNVYLECIAVKKGSGDDKVPEMKLWVAQNVPYHQMLLRITHALKEKGLDKYNGLIGKKWWKDKAWFKESIPYIIALNTAELEYPSEKFELAGSVLFGIWDQAINIRTKELSNIARPFIEKRNGRKVCSHIFETQEYENVSAVMFCDRNMLHETHDIEQSLLFMHNPLAKNKLDEKLFWHIEQWRAEEDSIIRIS